MTSGSDLRSVPTRTAPEHDLQLDVAIIGAGASGLYSAYRLTEPTSGRGLAGSAVQVFEMGSRIGGRLESVRLPGMRIVGELGGMRYMTSQRIVTTLIEEVFASRLTATDFPMGDDAHLLAYLRKQRLRQSAWADAQAAGDKLVTRYFLNEADLGFSADQLFNKIVYDVLMADPWFVEHFGSKVSRSGEYDFSFQLTPQDWDAIKPRLTYHFDGPYRGMAVNDLGFWNLIKDRVGEEGYTFLANAGGYYSNTLNWNAAEAFPYMVGDFSDQAVKYRTIEGGYDGIAYALANAFVEAGGTITLENQLLGFEQPKERGPRRYVLEFLHLDSSRRWRVHADHIILAMPRRSLELLNERSPFFDPKRNSELDRNIRSVIMEPSFKVLMGFESPWWKQHLEATAGHSITDLPLRQCYYFGTDPENERSLLLASYNDMRTVTFWSVLAESTERFQHRVPHPRLDERLDHLPHVQASRPLVAEALAQLRELHGDDVEIPEPYVTWYKDWTLDPFGGGYHAWKAGVSVEDVMRYMRRPEPTQSVYVCGEAYSDRQGWVEGAFCVAEKMLQEHFALPWPSWLEHDYYLGW